MSDDDVDKRRRRDPGVVQAQGAHLHRCRRLHRHPTAAGSATTSSSPSKGSPDTSPVTCSPTGPTSPPPMMEKASMLDPSSPQKFHVGRALGEFDEAHRLTENLVHNLRLFEREEMTAAMCAPAVPTYNLGCANTAAAPGAQLDGLASSPPSAAPSRSTRPRRCQTSPPGPGSGRRPTTPTPVPPRRPARRSPAPPRSSTGCTASTAASRSRTCCR